MSPPIHLHRHVWAMLLCGSLIAPPMATAQQLRAAPKQPHAGYELGRLWSRINPSPGRLRLSAGFTVVSEVEPNGSAGLATAAVLGDTVSGTINPAADVDYFAFDVTAGTDVLLDVDASQDGSPLDPIIGLFGTDGQTVLASNDDYDGLDSRLHVVVPTTGRYYAAIMDWGSRGGPDYFYRMRIAVYVPPPPPTPGPGDPTVPVAQGFSIPLGITTAADGGMFVADLGAEMVYRISGSGVVSTFASSLPAQDLVIDSYGDLLVASRDSGVYRFSPSGSRSRFLSRFIALTVTVDHAGDVWVGGFDSDSFEGQIRRYDARGGLKSSVNVSSMPGIADLAFSPSGQLFASAGSDGVYRITEGGPVLALSTLEQPLGIAFDEDGYLYVANGIPGEIHLYDPSLQEVGTVFARSNLSGPILLAFARNNSGAMTSRLVLTNVGWGDPTNYPGAVLEVNQAAVRAPGFSIGVGRPALTVESVADAFLGDPGAITADQAEFLDQQGNGNGRLDVADFRVFLRLMNASAATAGRAAR